MLAKTFCVVFLATFSVSLANEEDLVNTILTAGTNIMKESSKSLTNDPEKYSADLNALYKKYEVEEKANQAGNYLKTILQRGFQYTHESVHNEAISSEEDLKEDIDVIKNEDPALGEKLRKFHKAVAEYNREFENVIKYALSADKIDAHFNETKAALDPFRLRLVDIVKKFESGAVGLIKKNKKE